MGVNYVKGMKHPVSFYDKDEMEPEEFRPVTYPGIKPNSYMVSNYGEVYSLLRNQYLTPQFDRANGGHARYELRRDDGAVRGTKVYGHQLVAHEFLEPDPREDANIINHKDGFPYKNYYKNLEYCTDQENREHAKINDLIPKGEETHNNKYSESLVHEICSLFEQGMSRTEVRNKLGLRCYRDNVALSSLISDIHRKRDWGHITKEYNF